MKKIYAIAGFALLFAGGVGAAPITWQLRNYNTGSVGYLPRLTSDGYWGLADIFQTATGFADLAYQDGSEFFVSVGPPPQSIWDPYSFLEFGPTLNYVVGHAPSISLYINVNAADNQIIDSVLEVHQGGQNNGAALWYTLGSCLEANTGGPCGLIPWSLSEQYDNGFNPSAAMENYNVGYPTTTVVEVHQAMQDNSQLWYHIGTLTAATLNAAGLVGAPTMAWNPSAYEVTNSAGVGVSGYDPTVSVSNGFVLVAYQGTGGSLWYSLGKVGDRIAWNDPVNYDSGYNPSISLQFYSNDQSYVIEAHQAGTGTGPLWYRVGSYGAGNTGITWTPNAATEYETSGCYPSVTQGPNLGVGELHSTTCGATGDLLFSVGYTGTL